MMTNFTQPNHRTRTSSKSFATETWRRHELSGIEDQHPLLCSCILPRILDETVTGSSARFVFVIRLSLRNQQQVSPRTAEARQNVVTSFLLFCEFAVESQASPAFLTP